MNKNVLDIAVMIIAFVAGLAVSVGNNPLFGIALMLLVLTGWNVAPKLPKMVKSKVISR